MAETNKEVKIVKADKKKDTSKDANASKVQIKAVDLSVIAAQKKKTTKTAATKTTAAKPAAKKAAAEVTTTPIKPIGTPMKKSSSASAMKKVVPTGAVPMKKKDSVQKTEEVAEVVSSAVVETEVKVEEKAPKKKTEKAKVETEVEAKEAVKEVKEAKSEIKEVKAEEKKEEQAPKKAEPEKKAVDYTPGFGVKIIRRAADEPAPIPSKPAKSSKPSKDGKKPGDKKFSSKNNGNSEEKKPKEYTGRKPVKSDNRDKVNNFNNQSAGPDGRRQNKNKKDKRDYMDEIPSDLSRNIKKKHSKYKEKVDLEPTAEQELIIEAKETGSVLINVPITLGGFCEQIEKTTSEAIMALMKMGIMANINQNLDEETAVLLGMELGVSVMVNKNEAIEEEEGIDKSEDRASDLVARAPIVTVMGHVDHGKTSLLDAIRSTNVTAGEAGGITQAIGASEINYNGQHIVFLDTPGHEAFTAMRARGAHITDIAVLVVAADDSVMPQTIESISHAKSAGVPVIVAINKIDKPTANLEKVKTDLAANGLLVEDWGGDVIAVPVSAKTGEGISKLLEMILLQAEVLELKANPNRLASGNVIEAKLDKNRGPVASLLVMNGTLQAGAAIVAGTACGRVRVMTNPKGEPVKKAGPARAVEITGLTEVPEAGDEFYMVKDEKTAREIAEKRKEKLRNEVMAKSSAVSLEKLFSTLSEGEIKDLNIIIKADVQGSVGALEQSLEKLHNDNVRVKIIHSGVGAINESDVVLASTSGAVIIGFNVRPSSAVTALADQEGVEIRTYRIIYEIIDDIEAAMKGMLDPEFKEVILGKIEVRQTYKISNVGTIAGAYVIEGKVTRSAKVRIVRDGIVVHEGEIASLKRFKDDAKEVATGFECGIGIDKFNDIKEGDIIEAFEMQEVKKA